MKFVTVRTPSKRTIVINTRHIVRIEDRDGGGAWISLNEYEDGNFTRLSVIENLDELTDLLS